MAETDVSTTSQPKLTRPMLYAFTAFVIFFLWSLFPNSGHRALAVTPAEYEELKKFTLFFIGAILPSDALIRFGRNILFSSVEDADTAAKNAPATTLAQDLAFVAFLIVAALVLVSDKWIDYTEAPKIIDVARTLVIALLPSDAGVRFGRAIYLKSLGGTPTTDQLKRA